MKTDEKTAKDGTSEARPKIELLAEHMLPTAGLAVAVLPEAKHVIVACFDGGIYQVDTGSGARTEVGRHDNYASGVAYLPGSNEVISAGYDGALIWHDLEKKTRIRRVEAHQFWSWRMAVSADERWVASVTGAYRAGGYRYEPAAETEPSVKVFEVRTGALVHSFSHVPPVLSVAFSPDGRHVAAGNLMGEVRVWDLETGKMAASWTTAGFTSWGVIKSHHYVGGIFSMTFSPDGESLYLAGMGPMGDPMAGNGKQHWERYAWRENPARKLGEITDAQRGNGLMETIVFHPRGGHFVMAGRLAQGKWNTAAFETAGGGLVQGLDTKIRVTGAGFSTNGERLCLVGAVGQERAKDGKPKDFGRVKIYRCSLG